MKVCKTKGIYSHRTKNMYGEPHEHFIIYILASYV